MGFVSCLEDCEDRRTSDMHSYQSWGHFCGTRERLRSAQGRAPRLTSQIEGLERYLRNADDKYVREEAYEQLGDPFSWPKRVIADLEFRYRDASVSGLAHQGKWARYMKLVNRLDEALSQVPRDSSAFRPESLRQTQECLNEILEEQPTLGDLSLSGIATVLREANGLREAVENLKLDLERFRTEAEDVVGRERELFEIEQAAQRLESLDGVLERDFAEVEAFLTVVDALEGKWRYFLRLHGQVLRPVRQPVSGLRRLYLDEGQDRLVESEFSGHWRVNGPSGSGKTIILLHRAIHLARRGNPVQLLTLNRALASQMKSALHELAPAGIAQGIDVVSVDDLYLRILHEAGLYQHDVPLDAQWEKKEGIAYSLEWCQFFGGNGHPPARIFTTIPQGKKKKRPKTTLFRHVLQAGGFSELQTSQYLREEVRYVRSGFCRLRRKEYLEAPRTGRGLNHGRLSGPHRNTIIQAAALWDSWLERRGRYDHERLAQAVLELCESESGEEVTRGHGCPHVLIDEAQDLSTIDLRVLCHIHPDPATTNAMFFVGDFEQSVHGRHAQPSKAGLSFQGRSTSIRRAYRSTRQILAAARTVVMGYPPPRLEDAVDVVAPEESPWEGPSPLALEGDEEQQIAFAVERAKTSESRRIGIVAENDILIAKTFNAIRAAGLACTIFLENDQMAAPDWGLEESRRSAAIGLGGFRAVKGLEFDTVIVLDMDEGRSPRTGVQTDELWRSAAAAYSAMTRARDELFVLHGARRSRFVDAMAPFMEHQTIKSDLPLSAALRVDPLAVDTSRIESQLRDSAPSTPLGDQ